MFAARFHWSPSAIGDLDDEDLTTWREVVEVVRRVEERAGKPGKPDAEELDAALREAGIEDPNA